MNISFKVNCQQAVLLLYSDTNNIEKELWYQSMQEKFSQWCS